jgi:Txe/YoeB family toxin of Txe-Axe toxin-antitoxin module
MRKIKTVFVIDRDNGHVAVDKVVAGSDWVVNGEGVATIKFDGTSCLWKDGKLWKRYDRKVKDRFRKLVGKAILEMHMFKEPPEGFEPCEETWDTKTGHWPGWVPVSDVDIWHREGLDNTDPATLVEGATFELVGPRIQGNTLGLDRHMLLRHGCETVEVERSFAAIKDWLSNNRVEGLVFHHPDGRMAKIRRKDFGFEW